MKVRSDAPAKYQEMKTWGQWDVIDLEEAKRRAKLARKYKRWKKRNARTFDD